MEESANLPDGILLKMYPPEGVEDDTSVDIIAIHGLGTETPRTWEYKIDTRIVNWLSDPDMLPDLVPSARIYAFSWNANYSTDAPVIRILNVAEILLSNLKRHRDRDDNHSRPLIFIASCFGGLVITKAFEIANIHDSTYRKLLVATTGIVFLGSPLQGTRAGKAAQWHVMIAGILNKHPSKTLLQDLDGSTKSLRETSENFVRLITKPPMQTMTMCFWESQKTQVFKAVLPAWTPKIISSRKIILVEEDSACLFGRPKQLLDAPHSKLNKFSGPNDANFGLVSDAVKKMVEEANKIAISQREGSHLHNEHFMVSRRPNPLFTGREEELRKLKQALCPSHSTTAHTAVPKIYVIHGLGGAGKSEVVLKFASDYRTEFWGVFWIDGRSKSSITDGFVAVARRCGHHDESLEGGMSWLQDSSHYWLLIIDNADNESLDLAQFFPAGKNGSILITTRLPESAKHQNMGNDVYERLDQGTAISLLFEACDIEPSAGSADEDNARAITELLGCHALAIMQAGAAISQGLCTLGEYKEVFLKQRQALLECFPTQARSEYGGVYATFEVSATNLKARDDQIARDALKLLEFYALMHFEDFPEAAFEEAWKNSKDERVVSPRLSPDGEEYIYNLAPWHVSHLPTFMRAKTHGISLDKISLRRARSLLANLSLVTFDSDRRTTRMHPVSHFWSRDRLREPEESLNAKVSGLSVLSLATAYNDTDLLASQLQPHIESVACSLKGWDFGDCNFHFQQSVYLFSWVMYNLSCHSALFELLQMIPIQANGSSIRTENGQTIQMLHGMSMRKYDDASKAVIMLEQVNEARVQSLSADDPKTLSSQHALGSAYLEIENTTKAIALFEHIVLISKDMQGLEDSNVLGSQHELARAYLEIRETAKAIAMLEEVMEIRAKMLRPEHSDLLMSKHELARAYLYIEEPIKAIAMLKEVVEIQAKTLRPEHSNLLTSKHELARAYLQIGEPAKAIAMLEEVMEIRAKTLRPEHSDLLTSKHELARAYRQIGEPFKAIASVEPVVEIQTRTLRPDDPRRIRSIYLLAQCHCRARNYKRALELARSIENVVQNRPGEELADWNAELIGFILEYIELEEASD